jgi:hypothetical protein
VIFILFLSSDRKTAILKVITFDCALRNAGTLKVATFGRALPNAGILNLSLTKRGHIKLILFESVRYETRAS